MRKSVRRYYEHHRSYDFGDFFTMKGKRVSKKRAHKRLRSQLREEMNMEVECND